MARRIGSIKRQSGQAYAEVVVGFVVIGLFMFGAHHLWRYAEAQQAVTNAVRFAAWERVAWEPSDNSVEKHALHKSDASLARDTVMHQLSTPAALRAYRSGISATGSPAVFSQDDRRGWLKSAMKSFVSVGKDPNAMVAVTTTSGWTNEVEHWFRGRDPSFNTTTSLELDKDTYRTVKVSFKSQLLPTTLQHFFDFALTPLDNEKKLSLITNSWAASPPMMKVRTVRQLLPLSSGDEKSGTQPNPLAFFGLRDDTTATTAADFVGMVPFWNFVGGPNGMAGQYVVRKIGLDAGGANGVAQTGGHDWNFNSANPAESLLLKAQIAQGEFFNPVAASGWHHRHTFVIDTGTAQKSRNANIGKRKYRAISLQNPVETYYAE